MNSDVAQKVIDVYNAVATNMNIPPPTFWNAAVRATWAQGMAGLVLPPIFMLIGLVIFLVGYRWLSKAARAHDFDQNNPRETSAARREMAHNLGFVFAIVGGVVFILGLMVFGLGGGGAYQSVVAPEAMLVREMASKVLR